MIEEAFLSAVKAFGSWCEARFPPSLVACYATIDKERTTAVSRLTCVFTDLAMDCKLSDSGATLGPRIEPQESSHSVPLSASDSTASDQPDHAAPNRSTTPSEPNGTTDEARLNDPRLAQTLSRRKSYASGHEGEDWVQIERLISRTFGHERKANSEEEKQDILASSGGILLSKASVSGSTATDQWRHLPRLASTYRPASEARKKGHWSWEARD